ncbi:MAG: hypothetical protein ABI675_30645 [Chitinophagaceae bacterium]
MRFLFLTALLLLLRISLVEQTGQYSFSQLDYSVPSRNRVNFIRHDAEGFVWFSTMSALTVMTDIHVNFFTGNMIMLPCFRTNGNFIEIRAQLFPMLKLTQCVS